MDQGDITEEDLRWVIESQMIKLLKPQAEISPNGSLVPKGINGNWEFVLNAVDDFYEFRSQRSRYVSSITLFENSEVAMCALMCPEQNELYFTSWDQAKAFRNNEQIFVNQRMDIAECSIAVCIGNHLFRTASEFDLKMLQELFQISARVLTNGSYLFSSIQVATGKLSGLIAVGLRYQDIAGGLQLIEFSGGKITDENGCPYTTETEIYVASNGLIHDQLLEVFQRKWA